MKTFDVILRVRAPFPDDLTAATLAHNLKNMLEDVYVEEIWPENAQIESMHVKEVK